MFDATMNLTSFAVCTQYSHIYRILINYISSRISLTTTSRSSHHKQFQMHFWPSTKKVQIIQVDFYILIIIYPDILKLMHFLLICSIFAKVCCTIVMTWKMKEKNLFVVLILQNLTELSKSWQKIQDFLLNSVSYVLLAALSAPRQIRYVLVVVQLWLQTLEKENHEFSHQKMIKDYSTKSNTVRPSSLHQIVKNCIEIDTFIESNDLSV